MADPDAARLFHTSGDAYDRFMGRYSQALASPFADFCRLAPGDRFLDVGVGPGALTAVAADRLGVAAVLAVDPSAEFVAECRRRCPGVWVELGSAADLPLPDDDVDCAAAQLVLHFVPDPPAAVAEMARVVRPGGLVAANVWDFSGEMQLLRFFWDAALDVDPQAPDEARTLQLHRPGELAGLFAAGGLEDVQETTIRVSSQYEGFEELWSALLAGIGPAGGYAVSRPPEQQELLRAALQRRLGWQGEGPFVLHALARAARGRVPA